MPGGGEASDGAGRKYCNVARREEAASMKRSMAVLAALAIGFTYSPPATVALAEENEDKIIEAEDKVVESKENEADTTETEDSLMDHLLENLFSIEEDKEGLPDDSSLKELENAEKEIPDSEASSLKNLHIPQKFEVVIDPWEMDGRGQIYSEQYLISNIGDTPGILTLSNLVCRPREQSGVVVRTDKEGLHDSGDKSIYMEMVFRNEERIVFSKESCQYQTELKPGEELSVCFVGEVNENAFGKWQNDDIAVSLVYSWEMEEKQAADDMEKGEEKPGIDEKLEEIREKQENVIDREEAGEKEQEESKTEHPEENSETEIKSEVSEETLENGMDEKDPEDKEQEDINTENPEEEEQEDTDTENLEESSQTKINSENSEEIPETDVDERQSQEQQNGAGEIEQEKEPSDRIDTELQQNGSTDPSSEAGQETSETPEEEKPAEERKTDTKAEPEINEGGLEMVDKEEEEIKTIELLEQQKIDVVIDSWIVDEQEKIASKKYLLKNTGETSGNWNFTDLICKPREQSGIGICTDHKQVDGKEAKSVYMELVLGNGEKVVLSQKNSVYGVKLEPGEEVSVCFVGEMSKELLEIWEEKSIEVTAVCSWDIEQTVME